MISVGTGGGWRGKLVDGAYQRDFQWYEFLLNEELGSLERYITSNYSKLLGSLMGKRVPTPSTSILAPLPKKSWNEFGERL